MTVAATVLFPSAAQGITPATSISGYVAFMNMYEGRGISQSMGKPAVRAELDLNTASGFYAGLNGSTINWIDQLHPGDSVSVQINVHAGYKKLIGDWTFKGGIVRFQYPGRYVEQNPPVERPDTTELMGFVGWRWFGAKLNYSVTDNVGIPDSRGSWYLDMSANTPHYKGWSASVHLARRQLLGLRPATGFENSRLSYTVYNITTKKAWPNGMAIELDYVWTNADSRLYTLNGYELTGHHLILQLKKSF